KPDRARRPRPGRQRSCRFPPTDRVLLHRCRWQGHERCRISAARATCLLVQDIEPFEELIKNFFISGPSGASRFHEAKGNVISAMESSGCIKTGSGCNDGDSSGLAHRFASMANDDRWYVLQRQRSVLIWGNQEQRISFSSLEH